MKKDLGSVLALYPTPLVVVGAMVNGMPTWTLVGHVGIAELERTAAQTGVDTRGSWEKPMI